MTLGRVLIIGGNGFIGSAFARHLAFSGVAVRSLDICEAAFPIPGVEYVAGSFFEDSDVLHVLEDCSAVVHAVSTVNPGSSEAHFMRPWSMDVPRSAWLFAECAKRGQRVLFLSSGGTVYGPGAPVPTPESTPLRPANHYGAAKAAIEAAASAASSQQGADIVVARLANPYGPGQDSRRGVGFIDAVVRKALAGEPVEIWGDGSVVRDYIWVGDACRALEALLGYAGPQRVFNVGTGIGSTQLDVIGAVRECGLDPEVRFLPARGVDIGMSVLDCSLLGRETGLFGTTDLLSGIGMLVGSLHILGDQGFPQTIDGVRGLNSAI